jgi:integrase-like protein
VRLRAGGHARPCSACGSSRPPAPPSPTSEKTRPPGAARVRQGHKVVLVPLPPASGATGDQVRGPILLNSRGTRMDRHAANRRLRQLAEAADIQVTRAHPHMLRHTFVTTMPGCRRRPSATAMSRSPPTTPARAPRCTATGPPEPGPPPELHPRRLHGLRHLTPPESPSAQDAGEALHCRCERVASTPFYAPKGMFGLSVDFRAGKWTST